MRRVSRQTSRWRPLRSGYPAPWRLPRSVGMDGVVRCWKLPNTKNRGERQGTPAVNPWQVALLPPAAWTSMKIIPGNRRLSFTRRRASPTGATHDCPVAGYPAADDIGFPSWGISPTRRAVGGAPALPKGAPPTLNYLPGGSGANGGLEIREDNLRGPGVRVSVANLEPARVLAVMGRRPSLSAARFHCLGGLAGANPRLAVDVCDRRCRLW